MSPNNRNLESGRSLLRVVMVIAIVLAAAYGGYKLIPWGWHASGVLLADIRGWWHTQVADPIFEAMIQVLVSRRGDVLATLVTIALAYWSLSRIALNISMLTFRNLAKQPQIMQENVIAQMENVHSKLKGLFADDVEKIALFGGKINRHQPEIRSRDPFGCLGCIPGMLWMAFALPISFMIGLATYDGIVRLFVAPEPADSLLISARRHAEELSAILPIENTVSLAGVLTTNLSDRSLALTVVLFAIGTTTWFINNISNSGWTLPRLANSQPALVYLTTTVLSYFFLDSALLIFATSNLSYNLLYNIFMKFLFRPLYLRAKAMIAARTQGDGNLAEDA